MQRYKLLLTQLKNSRYKIIKCYETDPQQIKTYFSQIIITYTFSQNHTIKNLKNNTLFKYHSIKILFQVKDSNHLNDIVFLLIFQ